MRGPMAWATIVGGLPLVGGAPLVGCGDDPAGDDAAADVAGEASGESLCAKYGGAGTVATVVQSYVVPEIAADCRIGPFFTSLSSDGLTHVVECLTIQVQELFGCAGITYAGATDSRGVACRSMAQAHVGLQVSQGDFDALIDDVVVGLTKAGVAADDINAAAPALLGMSGQIVEQPTVSEPTAEICP